MKFRDNVKSREKHGEKRRLILEKACEIAQEGDFTKLTKREIASKLGISATVVNYYFGTVADLHRAIKKNITVKIAK